MQKTFIVATSLAAANAHMAITLTTPVLDARDKTLGDAYRNPTPNVCHGLSPVDSKATITAGTMVRAKTTFGAGHDGGHCAWFISADQVTWYKLNDKIDCTKKGQDQPHDVTIPANVPLTCGTKCVLGWFWTPRSSGGCEIYSDCFDITINGAAGGIESSGATKITTPLTCQRIDSNTGVTPIYGALMISNDGSPPAVPGSSGGGTSPTPPQGGGGMPPDVNVDPATGCTKYTVQSGDTLSAIALRFDVADWRTIQALNNLANPDSLEVGQQLLMPGDCGTAPTAAPTTAPAGGDDVNGAGRESVSVMAVLAGSFAQLLF
jgi:hypothetical protein